MREEMPNNISLLMRNFDYDLIYDVNASSTN